MQNETSPAELAAGIDAARERLIGFVDGCTDAQWRSAPLEGDPRPVGVVVDHVAHAYEYLAGWIRQVVAGQPVEVNGEVVDALNAEHARAAASVTRAEATGHLRRSGTAISALVANLSIADLAAGDGRVQRLAQIAIRHPDDHRSEIEAALAG
jgi:DinB superfamily